MKFSKMIPIAVLVVFQSCHTLWALPTTEQEAQMVVTGWLKTDSQPLGMALGRQVMKAETFSGDNGEPVYYIVYLQPSGFVVVPADDLVEPIIAFVNGSSYDPSIENPLGALVTNDLNERIAAVRSAFSPLAFTPQTAERRIQRKWRNYISLGETSDDGFELMNVSPIREGNPSDLRVAPLVKTKWYQMGVYEKFFDPNNPSYKFKALGLACQNYYTPRLVDNGPVWDEDLADNFPCGCVATVMAQLMRYHRYPDQPDQPNDPCIVRVGIEDNNGDFNDVDTIYPDGTLPNRYMLGGNEQGGEYQWDDMDLIPDANSTQMARKAIGAICHDAGVTVNMSYAAGESVTVMEGTEGYTSVADALKDRFKYTNAITTFASARMHIGPGLVGMMNANLDAKHPVILGIGIPGHAVLVDGYGYGYRNDDSTAYHHLNMGWYGLDDCWYNLPDIAAGDIGSAYTFVDACIYNVFTSGVGEIISGRVLNPDEKPADANVVCLEYEGRIIKTVETDANGIFAFVDVNSNTSYSVWVEGRDFPKREVRTGFSMDNQPVSGNRWGIDFPGSPEQGILYVDSDMVAGANDGSDWNNAFVDLQDAIEVAANAGGEVAEIWVAGGTYKPDRDTGLRSLSFKLLNGVGIYGGFAGGETEREQRNPETNMTILSGDLNGDDGEAFANNDENSNHVVNGNGTDSTAVIDGFTIICGNANGSRSERFGGGIYIFNGTPTISNCIFGSSQAILAGGGMYNEKSSPTVTNCTFSSNSAERGGGMTNGFGSSPVVISCTFSLNSVNRYGGGMENYVDSNSTVIDCVFSQNTAEVGGGIYNSHNSSITVTNCAFGENSAQWGGGMQNFESNPAVENCSFSYNWALWYGGGIYNDNSSPTLTACIFTSNLADFGAGISNYISSPTLTDCNFSDNSATGNGGAIENYASNPSVSNCTFSWNSADWGGGMFNNGSSPRLSGCEFDNNSAFECGGGIENESNSRPAINTCRFINNSAGWGGGVRNYESSPEITNCMFIANSADNSGGGVQSQISDVAITNCTFSANSASLGGGIYNSSQNSTTTLTSCILWGNTGSQIYSSGAGTADAFVTYSDVQNGWVGDTNISVDPLFGDVDNGDYHLKSQGGRWDPVNQSWIIDNVTSPCIDAGDPASPVGLEPAPNGGRINMGAYGGSAEASKSL